MGAYSYVMCVLPPESGVAGRILCENPRKPPNFRPPKTPPNRPPNGYELLVSLQGPGPRLSQSHHLPLSPPPPIPALLPAPLRHC